MSEEFKIGDIVSLVKTDPFYHGDLTSEDIGVVNEFRTTTDLYGDKVVLAGIHFENGLKAIVYKSEIKKLEKQDE